MADLVLAHSEAIHITTTSGTALADANKLEDTSSFNLDISNTITESIGSSEALLRGAALSTAGKEGWCRVASSGVQGLDVPK